MDLISPEASSSEDARDTATENSPAEEEKERGHIDIEDTITSPSPVERKKTGANLKNKPPVVTRC